jgi:hypothetical protein
MSRALNIRRVAIAATLPVMVGLAIAWQSGVFSALGARTPENAIVVIMPYRYAGTWVFDDARAGLVREPFVGGIPEMIDVIVQDIPDAETGFRLYFSARPFPGYQKKLTWLRGDQTGNWYSLDQPPMQGWLCPAMFKYYRKAPGELYVKAEARAYSQAVLPEDDKE